MASKPGCQAVFPAPDSNIAAGFTGKTTLQLGQGSLVSAFSSGHAAANGPEIPPPRSLPLP